MKILAVILGTLLSLALCAVLTLSVEVSGQPHTPAQKVAQNPLPGPLNTKSPAGTTPIVTEDGAGNTETGKLSLDAATIKAYAKNACDISRNSGLPAQVDAGLAYLQTILYSHAVNQADYWVILDTARATQCPDIFSW